LKVAEDEQAKQIVLMESINAELKQNDEKMNQVNGES
jgi:hypothetical protein